MTATGRRTLTVRQGALTAVAVAAADQASKAWMLEVVLDPPRTIEMLPFFNLVTVWNRGISFGLLASDTPWAAWALGAAALAIAGGLCVWLYRTQNPAEAVALGLIIGGAVGNVIDRIRLGAVFDFLDFHAFGYHWPAFNIADAAITCGAVFLVVLSIFGGREPPGTAS